MATDLKSYLAKMFRYVAWADRRTLDSLLAAPAAHAEAMPLLAHLLAAEHVWLARLERRDARYPVWPTLGPDECGQLAAENEVGYRAFFDQLADDGLDVEVGFRTGQGHDVVMRVIDILTQVVSHGPYHRGQIAKIIGRAGGTVIMTDYFVFVREAETAG
jgi:uncharacterized damage-inducible protein DinB